MHRRVRDPRNLRVHRVKKPKTGNRKPKTMTANSQPPALSPQPSKRGWVNCFYRYYKGRKLGPYYVRRWKENGKLCKEYVKPQDLERIRAECQLDREMEESMNDAYRSREVFMRNADFYFRMLRLFHRGKDMCLLHAQFLTRLGMEGMRILGRPPLRRKITRELKTIDGQQVIVKTIHEFDGKSTVTIHPAPNQRPTTNDKRSTSLQIRDPRSAIRDFMVPSFTKNKNRLEKGHKPTLEQQFQDLYRSIFGHQPKTITG